MQLSNLDNFTSCKHNMHSGNICAYQQATFSDHRNKNKKAKRENNIKTHEFDSLAACERCEEKKKYYITFAMTSPPISDLSNK